MSDLHNESLSQEVERNTLADLLPVLNEADLQRMLQLLDQAACAAVVDDTGIIVHASREFAGKLKADRQDLVGKLYGDIINTQGSSAPFDGEYQHFNLPDKGTAKRKDGSRIYFEIKSTPLEFKDNQRKGNLLLHFDVSALIAAEDKFEKLAKIDPLTKLKNRKQFQREVNNAVFGREAITLLFINLDRFKYYNDTLGHFTGDALILSISKALQKLETKHFRVYRYAGDEFAVLLRGVHHEEAAANFAQRVMKVFAKPFSIQTKELKVSASIGISRFPGGASTAAELIQQATTAMQSAKEMGRDSYKSYAPQLTTKYDQKLLIEKKLRHALELRSFELFYQPQVDLKNQQVVGAEALLRWHDKELGTLPPDVFIPIAEKSGLIIQIGDWVLEEACREAKTWADNGQALRVGVNISPLQFQRPDFVNKVKKVLQRTGLDPSLLDLEITENDLLYHQEESLDTLRRLKAEGIRISIDDFGTGYSSLSYLRQFPVDTLKIDKSFIKDVLMNKKDQAIVTSIIQLAHNMKMRVIAEGVETKNMLPFLFEQQCDEMQGFLYSRPVPAASLAEYMEASRSAQLFVN
ncbi:EAL domain-containing protein [Alkalicoccus daliensis]|uniref:Diguanylate cyclase (GGDEF) domain-containing protein n=1 Tax=Alkalicoccus daliensis TaxID=745820 RepID=A0A1H0CQU6_9BACI|nr:EAL domain-containing protein [Alkalicoccus daliensis]SDN60297.1 diguanylate cyclase (GGDEF) domain-containing protein [Alkalicoccus daliensis]